MGSGKTTLGKALAQELGREFIDLDQYIEDRYCMKVKEIFSAHGEDGFRDIERRMLHEVSEFEDVVIACGGGTPCYFDNMEHMGARGVTVYLTAPVERLAMRLALPGAMAKRPLIAGKSQEELLEFVRSALSEREPYYSRAQILFSSERIETAADTALTATELATRLSTIPEH